MKKISKTIFKLLAALILVAVALLANECTAENQEQSSCAIKKGEKLTYSVYYKSTQIGTSILIFNGQKHSEGKDTYHITFITKVPGFKDVEEIYADKETFLPHRVYRRINQIIGFPTKITEEYNQEEFRVDITKKGKILSKKFSIEKNAPIHNAILLPYYYRNRDIPGQDQRLKVTLPKAEFDLLFKGKETMKTPAGEYVTYVFGSEPEQFTFWLSADKNRLPVKIESLTRRGYSLILRKVEIPIK